MVLCSAMMDDRPDRAAPGAEIPAEEERLLAQVRKSLGEHAAAAPTRRGAPSAQARTRSLRAYDAELVALRDEIGEARLEDVPALVAQMERLQGVSLQRAEARSLLVDPAAPYFGHLRLHEQPEGRPVRERDVLIGRASFVDAKSRVSIVDWRDAPVSQLYYRYGEGDDYQEQFAEREVEGEILVRRMLTIEQGALLRVDCPQGIWRRAPEGWQREDARETTLAGGEGTAARPTGPRALGSGGTLGQRLDRHLPEIAALIDRRQFELITGKRPGVVVIQGGAGSGKTTVGLHRIAYLAYAAPAQFPPRRTLVVTQGAALADYIGQVLPALGVGGVRVVAFRDWAEAELRRAIPWLEPRIDDDVPAVVSRFKSHPALLRELERRVRAHRGRRSARAVVELWAEVLTDRKRLLLLLPGDPELPMPAHEIAEAQRLLGDRVAAVLDREPAERAERRRAARAAARADDDDIRGQTGVDGLPIHDAETVLDPYDLALLLRAHQLLRAPEPQLAQLFVDEAQDLSPAALAVLIAQTTARGAITLAGDTGQRLFLDNGFGSWRAVMQQLGVSNVAFEPLRISYRSTREILALARHVMGSLGDDEPPRAPRSGAPVEAHCLPATGAAVAFLAEALRPLFSREPRATVAVLARHPEQADRYFEGLLRAEVPSLRRVRDQNFSFRPGIEVTDIRQVKGLEFDYVIVVDVNASSFGPDDESRHLLHIAATRAAHQLWLVVTATPSPLLPAELLGG